MPEPRNIIVIQTAFAGDVILTLPLVQVLKQVYPISNIDFVVIPQTMSLLINHPDIRDIIVYDKYGDHSGISGIFHIVSKLKEKQYDVAIVPHRSLRSALITSVARIPVRVGFNNSAGRWFFTHIVKYNSSVHEIERNLSLLSGLRVDYKKMELPRLYPSSYDRQKVDEILRVRGIGESTDFLTVAPGTVWATKRWLEERYSELIDRICSNGLSVCLVGGNEDKDLCNRIVQKVSADNVYSLAGEITFLQSAELIKRSRLLICNDSAPLHIASAVGTPVVVIFGATVPEFGFGPIGILNRVVQINGLKCRPCSIHGGKKCPIKTFDCMKRITVEDVFRHVKDLLDMKQ